MTALHVWRVEVLRLTRTRRLLVLVTLYLFLGVTGPFIARYAQDIFSHASTTSTMTITVADPTPADGILGFYKSAMQIGLLGCIVVTGLAVCIDARPSLSVFYRTRAPIVRVLVPRVAMTTLAACVAYTIGFGLSYYETAVLIGMPAWDATALTWSLGLLYTAFAVALTFFASALSRGSLGAVGIAIGVVLVLPIVENLKSVSRFLPSRLASLPTDIYHGAAHPSPVPAVVTALAIGAVGVAIALRMVARRQVG